MITAITVAAAWFLVDQATKWWILEEIMNPPRRIEITSFFNLVLGWNTGVSFGFLASYRVPPWLLALIGATIAVFLFAWLGRAQSRVAQIGIGMIAGGGLANATDRFVYGAVPDFLDFHLAGWHWPAFNMADVGIVCGTVLLILHFMRPVEQH